MKAFILTLFGLLSLNTIFSQTDNKECACNEKQMQWFDEYLNCTRKFLLMKWGEDFTKNMYGYSLPIDGAPNGMWLEDGEKFDFSFDLVKTPEFTDFVYDSGIKRPMSEIGCWEKGWGDGTSIYDFASTRQQSIEQYKEYFNTSDAYVEDADSYVGKVLIEDYYLPNDSSSLALKKRSCKQFVKFCSSGKPSDQDISWIKSEKVRNWVIKYRNEGNDVLFVSEQRSVKGPYFLVVTPCDCERYYKGDDLFFKNNKNQKIIKKAESNTNEIIPYNLMNDTEYGSFIDTRNGKEYKTIKIANQEWMAKNLNYNVGPGSWSYNNDTIISKKYGMLYNWKTAIRACPCGWRLPTDYDFKMLIENLGSSKNEQYQNLISSGFNPQFSGVRGWIDDKLQFSHLNYIGSWWSVTICENDYDYAKFLYLDTLTKKPIIGTSGKGYVFSVRCIRDFSYVAKSDKSNDEVKSKDGSLIDPRDGKHYKTVTIITPYGYQTWMAENLNTEKFCNGDAIKNANSNFAWEKAASDEFPAWSHYENKINSQFGKLYNPFTTEDRRGLCPPGWRVPYKEDFEVLLYVYGNDSSAYKELITSGSSGFKGLLGGSRYYDRFSSERTRFFSKFSDELLLDSEKRIASLFTPGSYGCGSYVRCIKCTENDAYYYHLLYSDIEEAIKKSFLVVFSDKNKNKNTFSWSQDINKEKATDNAKQKCKEYGAKLPDNIYSYDVSHKYWAIAVIDELYSFQFGSSYLSKEDAQEDALYLMKQKKPEYKPKIIASWDANQITSGAYTFPNQSVSQNYYDNNANPQKQSGLNSFIDGLQIGLDNYNTQRGHPELTSDNLLNPDNSQNNSYNNNEQLKDNSLPKNFETQKEEWKSEDLHVKAELRHITLLNKTYCSGSSHSDNGREMYLFELSIEIKNISKDGKGGYLRGDLGISFNGDCACNCNEALKELPLNHCTQYTKFPGENCFIYHVFGLNNNDYYLNSSYEQEVEKHYLCYGCGNYFTEKRLCWFFKKPQLSVGDNPARPINLILVKD